MTTFHLFSPRRLEQIKFPSCLSFYSFVMGFEYQCAMVQCFHASLVSALLGMNILLLYMSCTICILQCIAWHAMKTRKTLLIRHPERIAV